MDAFFDLVLAGTLWNWGHDIIQSLVLVALWFEFKGWKQGRKGK